MIDLVQYAEMLLILTPIVIPILWFLGFDWRKKDKTEIVIMICVMIGLIIFLMLVCIIIIETGNNKEFFN